MNISKFAAAVALGALAIGGAHAKDGGDQYPNRAETWLAGAVPPPGNYFINYFGYYGGELRDGNGKKAPTGRGRRLVQRLPFRPYQRAQDSRRQLGLACDRAAGAQKVDLFGSKSVNGVGDITIDPFIVSLAFERTGTGRSGWTSTCRSGATKEGDARQSIGANYWSSNRSSRSPTWATPAGRCLPS